VLLLLPPLLNLPLLLLVRLPARPHLLPAVLRLVVQHLLLRLPARLRLRLPKLLVKLVKLLARPPKLNELKLVALLFSKSFISKLNKLDAYLLFK
jgi:hypothetical protein